ncbi:hypothetical protein [Gloeothece verrucosa]|uniref:Uncharacterized protein n=1 Tax=Gloeothece verrucosa (strain PCC 7822) TaxID=497965 RepID=E0UKP2_GLOV7|nr:hypothetical protein [Gloeothece verrucosa]ADN17522.1 hypothetical protein Cyan7822_5657 [Gloeothece verrucosa PCC 7822]
MNEQTQIGKDIATDPSFEDQWWEILKVARGTMVVLVLAPLTGIFGRGPLSKATVDSFIVPLHVQYERFPRFRTPASIEVTFSKQTPTQNQAHLRLSGEIAAASLIQLMTKRTERKKVVKS